MPDTQALTERRDLPPQVREAQLMPSTFNEADNTVDVIWTTGARRTAYDYWEGTWYEEELAVDAESVDMSRFEAGAVQVIDGHRVGGGVQAIIGAASRGWIEGGQGLATLTLSRRPEMAGIVADIKAGVIRCISFGYSVQRYEVTLPAARKDGGSLPLYRATRWTPSEISFVTVPADPNAQTRSAATAGPSDRNGHQGGVPCEFVRAQPANLPQEIRMPQQAQQPSGAAPATPNQPTVSAAPAPVVADTRAAVADAQAVMADITELCSRHAVPQLAAGLVRSGATLADAQAAVLAELARNDAAAGGHRNVRVETVSDEHQTRMAGMQEALVARVDGGAKLTDNGRQYRGLSLIELGREMLHARGIDTRGMDRTAIAGRMLSRNAGFGTVSDFPSLLANVAAKRLRAAYDENPGTYRAWARRAPDAVDFKPISVVQLSAMPDLVAVNEHGEFKYGAVKDGAESYQLSTAGRIVGLTRQAIVNDDLRGFDRVVAGFGSAAGRWENRQVYLQLTNNGTMSDTYALFDATNHSNLATGAGSALQASSLTTARTAMRKQKGLQSEELNIAPAFLIVPAALEQTAYQLTSASYVPAKTSDINEFRAGGRTALEPIVEPVLDANSATAWYLAASNSQTDTVEYCYLEGFDGPAIDSEPGFDIDGISIRCRHDFATKAVDYRGLYKAAGA